MEPTPDGKARTEACFPAFGSAIGSFQKALAEAGVPELDVIEALEAVSRALDLALEKVAPEKVRPARRRA